VSEARLPPVTQVAMASLALIVAGGIYLAAHMPRAVPLAPAVGLLAASTLLLLCNVVALARAPAFNRRAFFGVARWALLAYAISAGLLEYVFLHDGVRGGVLVVLTLSLVVYAVHIPLLIGFTVARYQPATGGYADAP
jgi:hypothetical protein